MAVISVIQGVVKSVEPHHDVDTHGYYKTKVILTDAFHQGTKGNQKLVGDQVVLVPAPVSEFPFSVGTVVNAWVNQYQVRETAGDGWTAEGFSRVEGD